MKNRVNLVRIDCPQCAYALAKQGSVEARKNPLTNEKKVAFLNVV